MGRRRWVTIAVLTASLGSLGYAHAAPKTPSAATFAKRCRSAYQNRQRQKALDACRGANSLDAKLKDPYWILAEIYLGMGELDYATSYAQRLIDLDAEQPRGWFALGKIAAHRGERDQAKLFLQRAKAAARKKKQLALAREIDKSLASLAKSSVIPKP